MEEDKGENRKRYFREYYINNKDKYKKKGRDINSKTKRGRPKKKVEPFKITHLAKPITISFN
tara:strand:- start:1204 stop:1389 length:186 start_codon:yes stop_codon:yes gene_type:complete